MRRLKNILILLGISSFILAAVTNTIKMDCIFKTLFNIRCPGCGLTRSIRALLKLDIISSFKYNIFGPILFIVFIIFVILMIRDIIKNEDKTIKYTIKYLGKYYYIVIIGLIISMVINNIRKI